EATLVRQQGVKTRPRYKNHRVVDDAHGIVTAVKTTTGRINEGHELMGLIDQHKAKWRNISLPDHSRLQIRHDRELRRLSEPQAPHTYGRSTDKQPWQRTARRDLSRIAVPLPTRE